MHNLETFVIKIREIHNADRQLHAQDKLHVVIIADAKSGEVKCVVEKILCETKEEEGVETELWCVVLEFKLNLNG